MLVAKKSTLPQAMALLGEVLRTPTLPEDEFERLREERRETLEKAKTDPAALASRTLGRKLSPKYDADDPRYLPTIDESLDRLNAVTVQQVRDLYTKQLGGTHGELSVVGDFDVDPFVTQMKAILSNWSSDVPYKHVDRKAEAVTGEKVVILTPDKANAIYAAGLMFAQDDKHPDLAALEMGNFLLGGGTLASRLGTRVRQKEGLSYGVRSSFDASSIDPVSQISIQAICNPANIGKVDTAINEEVNKFLEEGVTAKELEDGKKAILEQYKLSRTRDGQLVGMLAENLRAGRDFSYYADLDKKIAALTPEQIRDAYRKHLAVGKLVVIHAGDFKQ
jgi:zinc protease